jgi:hypothetical protein
VREEAIELFVVANRELKVTRDDARLLVVAGGVASELENFGGEVFEDGSDVDWARARGHAKPCERVSSAREREQGWLRVEGGQVDSPGAPAPIRLA